jgi:hypothetical protein
MRNITQTVKETALNQINVSKRRIHKKVGWVITLETQLLPL